MQAGENAGARRGGQAAKETTADLVKGIAEDASTLVKQELLLAKQEVTEGMAKAAAASALLIVAGLLGLYALGFLFTTAAWGLEALGLPKSASFGIVTLVLLLVAGVLALVGRNRLAASKVKPELAQAELQQVTADLAAEAKVAAEGVKADLTGSVSAARAEAAAVPDKAKAAAGTIPDKAKAAAGSVAGVASDAADAVASQARDATEKARQRVRRGR
jgi:putative superfamily III holin-X